MCCSYFTEKEINRKSRKWHIIDYLKTFHFLVLHVLNQDSTTIQLLWSGTVLCVTQPKYLGACALTTHHQFCIMPTKLSCGRSWLVCWPYTPLFYYCEDQLSSPKQFLSREINFETFTRWVTHDTSHSKFALQDGNNVVTTIHRWFTLPAHMFTVMLLW